MGKEVSNGTGRLGLIDFTSHILLRHNHHGLRNNLEKKDEDNDWRPPQPLDTDSV